MANKRDLKKEVRYICGGLATECLLAADYVKGVDRNVMRAIVGKIAALQANALQGVSFSFDKVASDFDSVADYNKERRAYYKAAFDSFRKKFNTRVQEIVKEMNAALPQEIKDANKEAAK